MSKKNIITDHADWRMINIPQLTIPRCNVCLKKELECFSQEENYSFCVKCKYLKKAENPLDESNKYYCSNFLVGLIEGFKQFVKIIDENNKILDNKTLKSLKNETGLLTHFDLYSFISMMDDKFIMCVFFDDFINFGHGPIVAFILHNVTRKIECSLLYETLYTNTMYDYDYVNVMLERPPIILSCGNVGCLLPYITSIIDNIK